MTILPSFFAQVSSLLGCFSWLAYLARKIGRSSSSQVAISSWYVVGIGAFMSYTYLFPLGRRWDILRNTLDIHTQIWSFKQYLQDEKGDEHEEQNEEHKEHDECYLFVPQLKTVGMLNFFPQMMLDVKSIFYTHFTYHYIVDLDLEIDEQTTKRNGIRRCHIHFDA